MISGLRYIYWPATLRGLPPWRADAYRLYCAGRSRAVREALA